MFLQLRRYGGNGWGNRPVMGLGLLWNGALCVLFGIAILAAPELLAYLVATLLILVGGFLLVLGWKLRRMFR